LQEISLIQSTLSTNRALCLLKKSNPDQKNLATDECLKLCREALEFNANNTKAYLRMSQAYRKADQLNEALKALKTAIEIEPSNQTLRQEYKSI
jgi:cytochrome c-type biogenesis protein CcmH/NrfG